MKILAVDVGGTFIKYATMNESAEIVERGKIPTPMTGRDEFFQTIAGLYRDHDGIAMSLPGIIDSEKGLCITSGALKYNDGCYVARELGEMCDTKVTIENDARCAALAEDRIGALADVNAGFVLVFGTAVGSAFVKDGRVYKGHNLIAGEISYGIENIKLRTDKKFFGVNYGVPGLLKIYAKMRHLSTKEVTGEQFFQAVDDNENDALTCLDKFTRRIAVKIFDIQLILDPERFAIGGGISAQSSFIDAIKSNLAKIYEVCPVEFPRAEVVPCKFRNDANLIGAFFNWQG